MRRLASLLDAYLNPGAAEGRDFGFVLMVFPLGQPDRCNYMANVKRQDAIAVMKAQIERFKAPENACEET